MDQRIGLLGGGQLGHMLIEAAHRLKIQVNILDSQTAPAKQISAHEGHIDGSFKDADSIRQLAARSDVLTIEIEHVDTHILEEVSRYIRVEPSWKTIRTIQDKYLQKEHLTAHDVSTADSTPLKENSAEELKRIASEFGLPFMLKSRTEAYDGRGNFPVKKEGDFGPALSALKDRPLYAERWADFKMELAVMVVKTKDGMLAYPAVETIHEDSICKLVYAPARGLSGNMRTRAQELAQRAVGAFEGKGVFGVEMFLLDNGTLLVNEIAPRPHNSGHYTIEACPLSQYDAHLRAILDLPIQQKDIRLKEPAVMLNILGGRRPHDHVDIADQALKIPGACVHMYGKGDGRPGRKMGHVTITNVTTAQAEHDIAPLIQAVDTLRAERLGLPSGSTTANHSSPPPLVGIIMGSDSDLPTLEPALELLNNFAIPFECRITSAHRTPVWMASYASSASSRGLQVLIAAAGGAAHLPGMAAAHTSLPVIGVPVKAKSLEGLDSLLSIVQMPPGVPVATMAINASLNAALYAASVLGLKDDRVGRLVESYKKDLEATVMGKDERLETVGWKEYLRGMKR